MPKDWNACAREVGLSLSRYDGYSTYARLETILRVSTSDIFMERPSCYAAELISEVEHLGVSRRVAQDHILHGISLGFLERVVSSGGVFKPESKSTKKIDETARITLSPIGRTLRAARELEEKKFQNFLVTGSLLEHDFDMYGLLLKTALENDGNKVHFDKFKLGFRNMQKERQAWMSEIPAQFIKDKISGYVSRVSGELKETSIRHHYNLRRQWAKCLMHIDETEVLTEIGQEYAKSAVSVMKKNSMFWIAPTTECVRKMGMPRNYAENTHSAWDLLRPDELEINPEEEMIQQVATFMEEQFNAMRLQIFAQASLASIIPYVYFQEASQKKKTDIYDFFDTMLKRYRNTFYCMLTKNIEECYYQLHATDRE